MKKLIAIIVAMVMFGFNTASAMTEVEVAQYILDTVPGADEADAINCGYAYHNGGQYVVKIYNITLECSKNTLIKDWDRPSN